MKININNVRDLLNLGVWLFEPGDDYIDETAFPVGIANAEVKMDKKLLEKTLLEGLHLHFCKYCAKPGLTSLDFIGELHAHIEGKWRDDKAYITNYFLHMRESDSFMPYPWVEAAYDVKHREFLKVGEFPLPLGSMHTHPVPRLTPSRPDRQNFWSSIEEEVVFRKGEIPVHLIVYFPFVRERRDVIKNLLLYGSNVLHVEDKYAEVSCDKVDSLFEEVKDVMLMQQPYLLAYVEFPIREFFFEYLPKRVGPQFLSYLLKPFLNAQCKKFQKFTRSVEVQLEDALDTIIEEYRRRCVYVDKESFREVYFQGLMSEEEFFHTFKGKERVQPILRAFQLTSHLTLASVDLKVNKDVRIDGDEIETELYLPHGLGVYGKPFIVREIDIYC